MQAIKTADDFCRVVKLGLTSESLFLEFKEQADGFSPRTPPKERRRAQMELVEDIVQFANCEGGCIVYGLSEGPGPTPKLKIATGIVPIVDPDGLKQWIEDAIRNFAVPATFSREPVPIATDKGIVIAVNVPPSHHLVSVWDREQHSIRYPRRTSHGLDWFNPDEAERHLMNGSRAVRLALIQAAQAATVRDGYGGGQVDLIDALRQQQMPGHVHQRVGRPGPQVSIGDIRNDSFDLRVVRDPHHWEISVPFGVVRDTWLTHKGKVGLILDVFVILQHDHSQPIWLERFPG